MIALPVVLDDDLIIRSYEGPFVRTSLIGVNILSCIVVTVPALHCKDEHLVTAHLMHAVSCLVPRRSQSVEQKALCARTQMLRLEQWCKVDEDLDETCWMMSQSRSAALSRAEKHCVAC